MDCDEPGPSGFKILTRKHLYDLTKNCLVNDFVKKLDFIENDILLKPSFPDEKKKDFKHKFSYVKSQLKNRWLAAHKVESVFLKNNQNWLQGTIEIPIRKDLVGRPPKSFNESSDRSKRRKTQQLRESVEVAKLTYASQMQLRKAGNTEASKVVKDSTTSPTRAAKYRKALACRSSIQEKSQLTPFQALSIFVEAGLSRKQYEIIRTSDKKLFPCYSIIQKAKKDCYPDAESYRVTATCAEIQLQALLNHTSERLITYLEDVLNTLAADDITSLELISKWGCDGSQQSEYKQKFENSRDSDANIFQSSLVPVQLLSRKNNNIVLWQNPTPSSPRYCRPIRIRFVHETTDITNEEIRYINNQIGRLQETKILRPQRDLSIKHILLLTMVDGKICNAATQTSSTMRCYICKATSKDFNDLSKVKEESIETLQFGLSILHARIRFFEFLLHLSYKTTLKTWQIRSEEGKKAVKERKLAIQQTFREKLGLIVDVPKAGFGTTNDGNTSRRFFADAEVSAEITGLDLKLINRFKVILEVISSGHKIHIEKFANYTLETAKLYIDLYPWHPMSPTVHKILLHGPTVIKHALLPIGHLSEEAAEARNKHFRIYIYIYLSFARKFSREKCNLDVINRLLLTSDPLVTSTQPKPKKEKKPFSKETLDMLLPTAVQGPDEVRMQANRVAADESDEADDESDEFDEDEDCSEEEGWNLSPE